MEHTGKSFRTGQNLHSPLFSARDHARELDHRFSSDIFEIIAILKTQSDSFIAERMLIDILKP